MEGWVREHIEGIMATIGIASAVGVAAIFAAYFVIKKKVNDKRKAKKLA